MPVKATTLQSLSFEHVGLDQEGVEFSQLEQQILEGMEKLEKLLEFSQENSDVDCMFFRQENHL